MKPVDPAKNRRAGRSQQLGAAGAAVTGAGAAVVATAATACCAGPVLAPLVVAVLGASGAAWAAGLKPYAPWLLAGSLLLLGYGFWSAYRAPLTCDLPAATGRRNFMVRALLWLAFLVWLVAAAANLLLRP